MELLKMDGANLAGNAGGAVVDDGGGSVYLTLAIAADGTLSVGQSDEAMEPAGQDDAGQGQEPAQGGQWQPADDIGQALKLILERYKVIKASGGSASDQMAAGFADGGGEQPQRGQR